MQRILVIGPCGAGKSTLARELGTRLRIPVFHMDQLNWQPGWIESSKDQIRGRLDTILFEERWLIDGNYGGTLPKRLARADTVIYLDYRISLCVARLLKRIWTHRGQSRPDMPEGCPERFDLAFLLYVMRWNVGAGPRTEAALLGHEEKVMRLKTPSALSRWMATLKADA